MSEDEKPAPRPVVAYRLGPDSTDAIRRIRQRDRLASDSQAMRLMLAFAAERMAAGWRPKGGRW
jgi:hypothetical protein